MDTIAECQNYINQHQPIYEQLHHILKGILDEHKDKYIVWFQSRLKKAESLYEKINVRKINTLNDIIGFRIIYPWSDGLYNIANILEQSSCLNIYDKKITENNKVIYLFGKTSLETTYEIQLWPTIIYTCFEYEHDKIYKPKYNPTDVQITNSNYVRIMEHQLQDIIDQHRLVPYATK